MQLAVIIKGREFTIHVHQRGRGRKTEWVAAIADWRLHGVRDEVFVAPTEQAAAYLAWLELADRYGTPDTYPPGVSDLQRKPTQKDLAGAARKLDRLLRGPSKNEPDPE